MALVDTVSAMQLLVEGLLRLEEPGVRTAMMGLFLFHMEEVAALAAAVPLAAVAVVAAPARMPGLRERVVILVTVMEAAAVARVADTAILLRLDILEALVLPELWSWSGKCQ